MEKFGFYQSIRVNDSKVKKKFASLHSIYNMVPPTKGCIENLSKGEGCGAWCCKVQTPQLLYCEFLLIWNYISRKWEDSEMIDLFMKCMINAVDERPSKGCVFFDEKSCLCKIHKVRPYNCRIYGITPKEEFDPRYEKLKEEYKGVIGAVIKPQCSLVSTDDGTSVSIEDTNSWWQKINEIEHSIGIPKKIINDDVDGGSYRSPHDHIILYNMPENLVMTLAGIRMYKKWEDKMEAIGTIVYAMREFFKKMKNA